MPWTSLAVIATLFLVGGALVLLAPVFGVEAGRADELRRLFWIEFLIVVPVIGLFLAGGWFLAAALAAFGIRGVTELDGAAESRLPFRLAAGFLVGCGPLVLLALGSAWAGWMAAAAAPVALVLTRRLSAGMGLALIALGGALIATQVIDARPDGVFGLLFVFVLVETCDSFAALAGRIWGRTALLPRLSPRKTVEGLLGGLLVALPVGLGLAMRGLGLSFAGALAVSAAVLGAGFAGDILTSAMKRRFGCKDFPPVHALHGGVLDIYDSLLVAIPVFLIVR